MKLFYLTNRDIDSRDIYSPIIKILKSERPKYQHRALSFYEPFYCKINSSKRLENDTGIKVLNPNMHCDLYDYTITEIKNYKPDIIITHNDEPGIYQDIINYCSENSIKVIIIHESPLPLIYLGLEEFITLNKKSHYYEKLLYNKIINFSDYSITRNFKQLLKSVLIKVKLKFLRKKYHYIQSDIVKPYYKTRGCSNADLHIVAGQYDKNNIEVIKEKSNSSIVVGGWLRSDQFFNEKILDKSEVMKLLGLNTNDKYVVLVCQSLSSSRIPTNTNPNDALILAINLINKHKHSLHFIICIHPGEDINLYRKYFHDLPNTKIIDYFPDRLSLMEYSDFIVGFYSTLLFAAMIQNKIIITLDYVTKQFWYPFILEYASVIPALSRHSLESQILKILKNDITLNYIFKNQNLLLNEVLNDPKGDASRDISNIIINFIENECFCNNS
jgi:hypothetical protein